MRYTSPIIPADKPAATRSDLCRAYKRFLMVEEKRLLLLHRKTDEGMKVCQERTQLIDHILQCLYRDLPLLMDPPVKKLPEVAVVATGGYARGVMNPHSDIDLHYLVPGKKLTHTGELSRFVGEFNLFLDDLRLDVGHATDAVGDRLEFANTDNPTKTTLITTRFITGNSKAYEQFQAEFVRKCIKGQEPAFLQTQLEELAKRHAEHENTPFVQQPDVKEGCGGMRDYQNLIWVAFAKLRITDLKELQAKGVLDKRGWNELRRAYDFLLRVRNELHYHEKRAQDVLTMQLQGAIASRLGYEGKQIIHRISAFMHDYYIHVRNVLRQSSKVMDYFDLEVKEKPGRKTLATKLLGVLGADDKKPRTRVERFDGFHVKHDRIFADSPQIFKEDPNRLMRLFRYTQSRHLRLSPPLFDMVCNTGLVNAEFRYHKEPREIFLSLLENKGSVARVLPQMHRCDFLGKYLPEFGALTCRIQHEFFHSYAADEHTLRCIDYLDELAGTEQKGLEFYQRIYRELLDPAVLYMALILHDTGRAANKPTHTEESTMMADKVCRRLQIKGDRRSRLIFLVDNHLLMYSTSTKKDPDDPKVVEEFGKIMGTRENLDALTVMTMADSKGVGASGWTSFKDTSLRELYHNTLRYLDSPADFMKRATVPLDELKAQVITEVGKSSAKEVEQHFECMPRAYFNFRKVSTIAKHIRQFRAFHQSETPDLPVFAWEDKPHEGCSKFVVVGKDRRLLLGRIAGALASENLSIMAADFYKRTDGLVLDVFRVTTPNFTPVTTESTRRRVQNALTEALKTEDFHFTQRIKALRIPQRNDAAVAAEIPEWVFINNRTSDDSTIIELQAIDRIGLLYDVFRVIGHHKLNVTHARISTERGVAVDSIYVQTMDRQKVTDKALLTSLAADMEKDVLKRG
jgi:[protein-PII] uridylyltransferase